MDARRGHAPVFVTASKLALVAMPFVFKPRVDDPIVQKLVDFLGAEETLRAFETWMNAHCRPFDPLIEEHSLECSQVFEQYREFVDCQLDDFITESGMGVREIHERCAAAPETPYLQLFLASTEFESFSAMMRQRHQQIHGDAKQEAKEAEAAWSSCARK